MVMRPEDNLVFKFTFELPGTETVAHLSINARMGDAWLTVTANAESDPQGNCPDVQVFNHAQLEDIYASGLIPDEVQKFCNRVLEHYKTI